VNQLAFIGMNLGGFNSLLSIRFYTQIVRRQLAYVLVIIPLIECVTDQSGIDIEQRRPTNFGIHQKFLYPGCVAPC
ncbi:hypothetical protein BD560DRAFT_336982, partial [Blakeslea trispora]